MHEKLNANQQKIFDKIINSKDERKKILITGEQGVGKTTLLKALYSHFVDKNGIDKVIYLDGRLIGETTQAGFIFLGKGLKLELASEIWYQKWQIKEEFTNHSSQFFMIIIDELGVISDDFHCYLSGLTTINNLSIIVAKNSNHNRGQGSFYSSLESQLTTLILNNDEK